MSSRALAMAEIILEFFHGLDVDQILKFEPKNARNAVRLLASFNLVRIEDDKLMVTGRGERFIKLPYSK